MLSSLVKRAQFSCSMDAPVHASFIAGSSLNELLWPKPKDSIPFLCSPYIGTAAGYPQRREMISETQKRPLDAQTEEMEVVLTYSQLREYCEHIAYLEERKASLGNICLFSAASTIIPILGFVGYQAWLWVVVFSAVLLCLLFGVWSSRR